MKYNLTILQRLQLIPIKFVWWLTDPKVRKTWHLVKKGMEKHPHRYTVVMYRNGHKIMACEHEGCPMFQFDQEFMKTFK